MVDLIGQRLGQYEITALLGEGGMAAVYRARRLNLKGDVAIKVIKSGLVGADKLREFGKRFEREAETTAALSHPHILKLFDYGQQGDLVYLVMELLPGGSLDSLILRAPLSAEVVTSLLDQIAAALDYAHEQGIIHRDLKPQNVLLDTKGNAILTDFGIAKVLNETTALTASGIAMGTPAYMSPEQCQGRTLDGRSDIYSLGIMLFEMLAGEVPFKGDTPVSMIYMHLSEAPPPITSIRRDLSPSVEKVVNKALAKDPMQRFQSAGDLATAFKIALTGQTPPGVETPPQADVDATAPHDAKLVAAPLATDTPGIPVRRAGLLALGALGLVAVIGVLAIALSSGGTKSEPTQTLPIVTPVAGLLIQTATLTATQVATSTPIQTATPTPPLPTSTATETPNREILAAQTLAVGSMQTANAIALYTKTPTATFTPMLTNTHTATPEPTLNPGTKRTDRYGVTQVYVPAGCFMMGSDPAKDLRAHLNEQPQHQVCITHGYWLDAYEVTNAAYQQFVDAGGYMKREYWSDAGWSWRGSKTAPDDCGSQFDDPQQPRVCVSWYEAVAYATWRGGRLPTEAEWEYAARGPESLLYPWGNTWNSSKLNAENNLGQTAPVGSYKSGKSWVGAYDLAGNVWEWVADWYSATYYQQQVKNDPVGPTDGQDRTLRGGSWSVPEYVARAASRYGVSPDYRHNHNGIRVVIGVRSPSLP